jgi:hypothetical protein
MTSLLREDEKRKPLQVAVAASAAASVGVEEAAKEAAAAAAAVDVEEAAKEAADHSAMPTKPFFCVSLCLLIYTAYCCTTVSGILCKFVRLYSTIDETTAI